MTIICCALIILCYLLPSAGEKVLPFITINSRKAFFKGELSGFERFQFPEPFHFIEDTFTIGYVSFLRIFPAPFRFDIL